MIDIIAGLGTAIIVYFISGLFNDEGLFKLASFAIVMMYLFRIERKIDGK